MTLGQWNAVGFIGERRAVALGAIGFFGSLFLLVTLSARSELPEWVAAFGALTAIYWVAFAAVAAEWFWGRWFAIGIGYSGVSTVLMSIIAVRALPMPLIIFGASHGLMALALMGEKMAARFDAQPGWRQRWNINEEGVIRLRKTVIRAASSLPALVVFALAPRQAEGLVFDAIAAGVLATAATAMFGLLRGRSWSIPLLLVSGVASGLHAITLPALDLAFDAGLVGAALLISAVLPFVRPVVAFLQAKK